MTVGCVRTLIEIIGDDNFDHQRRLNDYMWSIGFVPKSKLDSAQSYIRDVDEALKERGLDIRSMVDEYRRNHREEAA